MPDFWRLLWDQDVHTVIILDLKVYQNGNQIKTVIILDLNVYQNGNQNQNNNQNQNGNHP